MLTGDENIVDIDFRVFWVINNAADYVFNMEDPDGTVKAVAESAMREVVGHSNIQPHPDPGARRSPRPRCSELIQETLDEFGAGILITQVQLLKVDPPGEVIASFRDVQAARADQERIQNEAQTYANKVVPEARGQASQITEAANAYRDQIIAEAQGPGGALRQGLRELQGLARRHPPPHVSRNDGAGARRHGQGHHRRQGERPGRRALPAARSRLPDRRPREAHQ